MADEDGYIKDSTIAKLEAEVAELKKKVASSGNKKAELEKSAAAGESRADCRDGVFGSS